MQNGQIDGTSERDHHTTPDPSERPNGLSGSEARPELVAGDSTPLQIQEDDVTPEYPQGPPTKRRKLSQQLQQKQQQQQTVPRTISPPWKSVAIEGPTSFVENGRRKSSRTNAIPLDLLPPSDKRKTRSSQKEYLSKSRGNVVSRNFSAPQDRASPQPLTNPRRSIGGKSIANGTLSSSPTKSSAKPSSLRSAKLRNADTQLARKSATRPTPSRTRREVATDGIEKFSSPLNHEVTGSPPSSPSESDLSPVLSDGELSPEESDHGNNEWVRQNNNVISGILPRLRFKVNIPSLATQNPHHLLPSRKYATFRDWVDAESMRGEELNFPTWEAALREARTRQMVREAGEPGMPLGSDRCSYYLTEPPEEPSKQYSHRDHLVAHALYFKTLLDRERKRHRHLAKSLAQSCAEVWRKRNKGPEDILKDQEEEMRLKRKLLVKDLQRQFDLVRAEVGRARLARWEQDKKMKDQLALNKAIKQSTMLFEKRRHRRMSSLPTRTNSTVDGAESYSETESSGSEDTDYESNMSIYDSESDEDDGIDDDAGLTAAELRAKYANLSYVDVTNDSFHKRSTNVTLTPNPATPQADPPLTEGANIPDQHLQVDEVDQLLLDESDESTDMDEDDQSDREEGVSSTDNDNETDEGNDASDSDTNQPGLLALLAPRDRLVVKETRMEVEEGAKEDEDATRGNERGEAALVPNGAPSESSPVAAFSRDSLELTLGISTEVEKSDLGRQQAAPSTAILERPPADLTSPLEDSAIRPDSPKELPGVTKSEPSIGTPIPHLLRGILREYQHYGLDWLAGLYSNNINGILADEMGLGKTIQTIAVLAHLAVEHEVWGPHLIVVPTSVMLNWEMEFKRWCPGFKILTYYGSQEERKQKRKGWMDDDRWHVCITSYQLVLQDQQTFKRRNWHYLILDEAQHIKNFRSQRWQTLLTFKSRARLLLTGTPLQNNLTELWSLLFFLMPSDDAESGAEGFADLKNFSDWFRRPVEQILEHGRETMDDEAKRVVSKLHTVLRPYILRRLKVDVEKQMPAKYEHVVMCRLSKRQRYLYDGFMARTQTKEALASGNYLSIINCLMQLRKVCNHPDLFETRPITTSFAMPKSAVADFEIKELITRRQLLREDPMNMLDLDFLNLVPISQEDTSKGMADDSTRIMAYGPLRLLRERQYGRTNWSMEYDGSTLQAALESMENSARMSRMQELERCMYFDSKRHGKRPVYGKSLIDFLTSHLRSRQLAPAQRPARRSYLDWLSRQCSMLSSMILSVEQRSIQMQEAIKKFACITPAVVASNVTSFALTPIKSHYFTQEQKMPHFDPLHEAHMRLSIAFPDKRLLQYDCGKLQQLDKLLKKLQSGGHRALIFTQMTKMLDILEQFLNIHGHRYLRLDGSTKIEERQLLTERFNSDPRILVFILSSRSGGLGINLTGADTVIFYDLDWNPAMDKQCQDRCHRIGQTRDVHIYRFVSEYTIEANILRKANQKRMLDDVVIQEGDFTTDYFQKLDARDMLGDDLLQGRDEASAAMDKVLDSTAGGTPRVFEQAEDKEDIDAAKIAAKELEHVDAGDFADTSVPPTPGPPGTSNIGTPAATDRGMESEQRNGDSIDRDLTPSVAEEADEKDEHIQHIDDYLVRFMEWSLLNQPLLLPPDKSKKKLKKGKEHRIRRHR